jgi:hypothetical protein
MVMVGPLDSNAFQWPQLLLLSSGWWNFWLNIRCWPASTFKRDISLGLIARCFSYLTIAILLPCGLNFSSSPADGGTFN